MDEDTQLDIEKKMDTDRDGDMLALVGAFCDIMSQQSACHHESQWSSIVSHW